MREIADTLLAFRNAGGLAPATSPRVVELAQLVTAMPMREAIVARARG